MSLTAYTNDNYNGIAIFCGDECKVFETHLEQSDYEYISSLSGKGLQIELNAIVKWSDLDESSPKDFMQFCELSDFGSWKPLACF